MTVMMMMVFSLSRTQHWIRQALLVSVSVFLFGFVSDTDTICQTKKKHKQIVRR